MKNSNIPTLVILHGFKSTSSRLDPLVQILNKYLNVYCPDLPGHGIYKFINNLKTIDQIGSQTAQMIDQQLGKNPYNILGISMGGNVAIASLNYLHNKPKKLFLYATPLHSSNIRHHRDQLILIKLIKNGLFDNSIIQTIANSIINNDMIMHILYRHYFPRLSPKDIDYEITHWRGQSIETLIAESKSMLTLDQTNINPMNISTYYLHALKDNKINIQSIVDKLPKIFPNCNFTQISNFTGHVPLGKSSNNDLKPIAKSLIKLINV